MPIGAKVGIDATIPEGIPHERFERIAYAYADRAKIADYLGGKADPVPAQRRGRRHARSPRSRRTSSQLIEKTPLYYSEVAEKFGEHRFRDRRARARQAARRREALAGPARAPVRARLGVRGEAAGQERRRWTSAALAPSAAAAGRRAAAITVAGVSKWFPTADGQPLHVLEDIDLAVPEHSIVAILGASGCGKSTLLNIISGHRQARPRPRVASTACLGASSPTGAA